MFGSQGIQPVTVVFINTKNCFLHIPSKLITHLCLNENQALELSWTDGSPVYLSWSPSRTSSSSDGHQVELSRQLGEKLGLTDGEQGFLRPCHQVSSLHQVFVEPLSSDDWEILELHSAALEQQLLDQIRVVFPGAVFPVWVDSHTAVYIQIASLSPPASYGRLEQFTELVVSPKSRSELGDLSGSTVGTSHSRRAVPPSTPSSGSHQWGGIAGLKSLFHFMMNGVYDSAKEPPPVPAIPALLPDSVYRVSASAPDSFCTVNHAATAVVHVFPWERASHAGPPAGLRPSVTYGLLSKVPSPKERKERAKKAAAKKKHPDVASAAGKEEVKAEQSVVVRVVCHAADELAGRHGHVGDIHSGGVWIPQTLATRFTIDPHSTVRIKPITSTVRVAASVQLQPLQPLPEEEEEEEEEEIRTSFLGWLHTQSHEPLACLTARAGTLHLHGSDGKLAFALTVLKPESEAEAPDQLFLLAPTVLQQKDVQVVRDPVTAPAPNSEAPTPNTELPSLSTLGGVDELSSAGFEFISHSLLARPLSRELGAVGRGLKGGALLVTGSKGSGKSALSRALCQKAQEHLDAHVEVLDCKKLQGKRADTVRQMLQDVFLQAEWMQPSVVLLDDLDHVTGAPASAEHEHGPEALLQLHIAQSLKDVVDEGVVNSSLVCLIVTSLSQRSLHPSLTEAQGSHFIQGFVHIQPPDQAQRAEILRRLILRRSSPTEETFPALDLRAVAKETEGYTPQDLVLLLERALHANTVHRGHSDQGVSLSWRDFSQALRGFTPPSRWGMNLHTPAGFGLERVGGLTEVRQQLMDTLLLPAKYPVLFSKLPIRHRSGILLYGAPGTGKTLLARAAAKDSGMNFIGIKGPELLSKYIGASEQGVRDVFQRAQAAKPCILFFDEFDSLAPRRGHDSTGVTDRVVNQLLTQLDGVEGLQGVYVLAATSRPDLIDPALLRPGRLDKSLYCPPPGPEERVEILKALSAGVPLAADVDLEQLAAATEQFTGADLKALLYNAQLEAVRSRSQELTCSSDSDMSLSSMMFPNHSGSDESAGEGDPGPGLDQSRVLLETGELRVEDERRSSNVWRLYFGSSYESESVNSPVSGRSSQSTSGPNSMTQDAAAAAAAAAARASGSTAPPAYLSSLQRGYEELTPDQLERLQQDVRTIRSNHRRVDEESVRVGSASGPSGLLTCRAHMDAALAATRPSLSKADWSRYAKLYEAFGGSEDRKSVTFTPGRRVTLA